MEGLSVDGQEGEEEEGGGDLCSHSSQGVEGGGHGSWSHPGFVCKCAFELPTRRISSICNNKIPKSCTDTRIACTVSLRIRIPIEPSSKMRQFWITAQYKVTQRPSRNFVPQSHVVLKIQSYCFCTGCVRHRLCGAAKIAMAGNEAGHGDDALPTIKKLDQVRSVWAL